MTRFNWFHEMWTVRGRGTGPRKSPGKRRPREIRRSSFERLEDRALLATLTVNSSLDNNTPGDGLVTLREAIIAANANSTTDLGQTGSGADTIEFSPSVTGTIALIFGEMMVTEGLTINGPGRDVLTINAQQNSRILHFRGGTGDFTINGLTLTGGRTTSSNPSLGAGGAISSFAYTTTINDCTITGNDTTGNDAFGGAIRAERLIARNSEFSDNSTIGNGAHGGAAYVTYVATFNNCTLRGNSATGGSGTTGQASGGGFRTGSATLTD
jgi:hypothetical protein